MLLIVTACILSSILLATIGCITVWNRYIYLSDGIIHILLLAALFHAIFGYPLILCSTLVSVLFVMLAVLCQKYFDDHNLVLNITTTTFIAIGIVVADYCKIALNIEGLFFGDILLVNQTEVVMLMSLSLITGIVMYKYFNMIVIAALNQEIAISYGIRVDQLRLMILLLCAVSISLIVKIIGGLIIGSLSIVPVFFAKIVSKSPDKMLLNSILVSVVCGLCGLKVAFLLNLSPAAVIAILQIGILFLTFLLKKYIL